MRIRSTLARRVAGAVAAIAVGSAMAAGAASMAHAKGEYHYWNSSSNPLKVSGYGSTGYGHGQWRIADSGSGTRSFLDARIKYSNADNHKVYALLRTYTNCKAGGGCDGGFYHWSSGYTPHYNVPGTWKWHYANTGLNPNAYRARAQVHMLLDVPWKSDPISGAAYAGPSNY